eukprot:10855648-Alexandrium_andersonii.AAC.1
MSSSRAEGATSEPVWDSPSSRQSSALLMAVMEQYRYHLRHAQRATRHDPIKHMLDVPHIPGRSGPGETLLLLAALASSACALPLARAAPEGLQRR